MTNTEAAKEHHIDEIVNMNIPPEDKVIYIADLCKHRGKMMDEDADRILDLKQDLAEMEATTKLMGREISRLRSIGLMGRWMMAINRWAKS